MSQSQSKSRLHRSCTHTSNGGADKPEQPKYSKADEFAAKCRNQPILSSLVNRMGTVAKTALSATKQTRSILLCTHTKIAHGTVSMVVTRSSTIIGSNQTDEHHGLRSSRLQHTIEVLSTIQRISCRKMGSVIEPCCGQSEEDHREYSLKD